MRRALGMNQVDLADKLGVDQSTVSDIERGAGFGAELLMRLTVVLGGTAALIMEGKDEAVWPFPRVKIDRLLALDPPERAYVEGRLASAIEECEAGRSPNKPKKLGILRKEHDIGDELEEADLSRPTTSRSRGKRQA